MLPYYPDIISRIEEKPTWYTKEGFPRYGEFQPKECNIYARYSTLMKIRCQDCGAPFYIGQDYSDHDLLIACIDLAKVDRLSDNADPDREVWIPLKSSLYAPIKLDEDGKQMYKYRTLQEIVEEWGFGDPPSHGCVGDTMGCIEIKSVQVWDLRYGEEQQPSEDNRYSYITKFGEATRITELEGHLFETYEWYRFYGEDD